MYLCDGTIGNNYKVQDIKLPVNIEKRLEVLGMTRGTPVTVLNSKGHGILTRPAFRPFSLRVGNDLALSSDFTFRLAFTKLLSIRTSQP